MIRISALFFLFGFVTCLNDILIPYLKELFALTYWQSMLIQFAFFSAYFVFSLPAGAITKRFGYRAGVIGGLTVAGVGAWLFLPAGHFVSYPIFLSALFVLASGITLLQVAANPYVSVLGAEHLAPARLSLVGAFNSLGTTLAPIAGAAVLLSVAGDGKVQTAGPYFLIGVCFMLLALMIWRSSLPDIVYESPDDGATDLLWADPQLRLGVLAIFFYVGAEVGIGSFLVNHTVDCFGIAPAEAGHYVAAYWFLAMAGRFMSTWLLRHYLAQNCLLVANIGAFVLVTCAACSDPTLSPWFLLLVGLCNSLMFPVIFTLSIEGQGAKTARASSYLCMAIVGGAVLPLMQGWLSDEFSVQQAFALPAVAYLYLIYFSYRRPHAILSPVPSL